MPRDWNQAYLQDDTPWDKGEAAPPLQAYLRRQVVRGEVLVPGCGSGHDVRLLAGQGARVKGLDLAPAAIERAVAFEPAADESYVCGNFLDLPAGLESAFDWIIEHTCLCALDPAQREAYARSAARALRPGGRLLAVFFCEVPDFDGEGPPFPITVAEIDRLFAADFQTLTREIPTETYPSRPQGCEELRVFQRHPACSGG